MECVVEHKEKEIEDLHEQLQNSIRPENLKEKVEGIVQKEVESRLKQVRGDTTPN